MKKLYFVSIIVLIISCKNEMYLSFGNNEKNLGLTLDRNDHRYYYGGISHGNWVKKGKYIILKSDLNPEKIEEISIDRFGDDKSSNLVLTSKYKKTGATPNEVIVFLYNEDGVKKENLTFEDNYLTIPKDSFNYDSISIAIPIGFEEMKYSFSSKIGIQIADSVSISITAKAIDGFYWYFNNRAFVKKGKVLLDPITLENPYLY